MNRKTKLKNFLLVSVCLFLFSITSLVGSDLKIVDPEDRSSAPDWGEIYISDDANYIYFLFHNYKPVTSNITPTVLVFIDADNNSATGDPGTGGADYRFKIAGLGASSDGWGTKVDPIEYWHNSWNSWQYITYKEEGGAPTEVNGNQSNDGSQTLPTGTVAGVACGILEFKFYKSWMVGSYRTSLGSVIGVYIAGDDPVGDPNNKFYHTITNNQTRTVDGRVGTNEWVADAIPPAAISNLTALTGTNEGEIILRWTAPGDDGMTGTAKIYIVKYSQTQITNFDTQGTVYPQSWTPAAAGTVEQKTLVGFTPGVTYYFAIVAVDDCNNKGSWSTSGVNTQNYAWAQNLPPSAPTNISYFAADKKITLSWTASSAPDINHYNVYYDTDSSNPPYTAKGSTGGDSPINVGNVTSYVLSGLVNFVTYYITITAVDNTNLESSYSTVISTTPFPRPNTPPNTPSKPIGPSMGAVGGTYWFSTTATDPDNDQIRYGWDWDGDGTVDEWSGYLASGQTCSLSHSWTQAGTYQIKVKAQDANGAESGFSTASSIIIGTEEVFDDYEDVSDWWTYYGDGASFSTSQVVGVSGNALSFTFTVTVSSGWWGIFKQAVSGDEWNFNNGDWSIYKSFKFYMKGSNTTSIRIGIVEKDATGSQDGEWWLCTLTPTTNWQLYEVTWASFTRRTDWQPSTTFRNSGTLDKDWIRAVHFIQSGTTGSNTISIDEFYLVKDVDITPPAAISNLTALPGTNDGEIILRWTAPGDDGMTGTAKIYIVKYSQTQITNFDTQGTLLTNTWQPNPGSSSEQRTITGLTPGVTYYFAIIAEDDWGNRGTWSTVGVNTKNYAPAQNLVPSPPQTVTVQVGDREITVSWSAVNVVDLKEYRVYYDTDSATSPYNGKGANQGDSPIIVSKSSTSIKITGIIPFVTYYITITAVDNTNYESSYSTVVSTAAYALDWDVPDPITDLSSQTGHEHGEVILNWTATGDDGSVGNIINGKYRIAYSTYTNGTDSFWETGTWTDKENKYKFEFSTNVVARSKQSYIVNGLRGSVTYYFKIWIADESNNFSTISNTATCWAQIDLVAPGKITTFKAEAIGDRIIQLSWLASSDDAYSTKPLPKGSVYKIMYAASNLAASFWTTSYAQITISTYGVIPGTLVKLTLTGLTEGLTYYFRIWAADERPNWSEISDVVAIRILGDEFPPAKITDLVVTKISSGKYKLSWTAPGDDGMIGELFGWYAIQATNDISKVGIRKFSDVIITTFNVKPGEKNSVEIDVLDDSGVYYFVLWAADEVPNWSDRSNIVCSDGSIYTDTTSPSKVTDLKVVLNFPYYDEAKLSWTVPGDDGYSGDFSTCIFRIQYSTVSSIVWDIYRAQEVLILNDLKANTTFQHYMWVLRRDATYYFALWVGDGKGNWSEMSNIAAVYTPSFLIPPDTTAPASITDLSAEQQNPDAVKLTWSTPGNNYYDGILRRGSFYKIQYSTYSTFNWDIEQAQIKLSTHSIDVGTTVSYVITNLYSGLTYYFAIWTVDQSTNVSDISNIASCYVIDTVAPDKVLYSGYKLTESTGVIILGLVISGDNGSIGDIKEGRLHIYYATHTLDSVSITDAQIVLSTDTLKQRTTVWVEISLDDAYGFDKYYDIYVWLEDEAGNYSVVSDTISIFVPLIEKIPPAKITTLSTKVISFDTIKLSWVMTGDDGYNGDIIGGKYIIKIATYPITQDNFEYVKYQIFATTTTKALSLQEISFKVTTFGTTYYIALKVADEQDNYSDISLVSAVYIPVFDVVLPKIEMLLDIPSEVTILRNKVVSRVRFTDNIEVKEYNLYFKKGNSNWQKAVVSKKLVDADKQKDIEFEIPYSVISSVGDISYYYYVSDGINYTTYGSTAQPKVLKVVDTTEATVNIGTITSKDANPYDGDVEIVIPAGIINNQKVKIKHVINQQVSSDYIIEPKVRNLSVPVQIKLLYFDLDDDGKDDVTGVSEKELAIYYYDEFKDSFIYIGGKLDSKTNTITAYVYNLGRYVIMPNTSMTNISEEIVSKKFITPANPTVSFSKDVVEVTIYSVSGKEVFSGRRNSDNEDIIFLGKDTLGNFLESGLYICRIKTKTGKVKYTHLVVSK